MKVLHLMYKLPFPGHDGGEISLKNSALGLKKQPNIDLMILAMKTSKSEISNRFALQDLPIEIVEVNTKINYFKLFLSLFQKKSYLISRYYSNQFEKKIIALLQNNDFDIILLEHICLGVYIPIFKKYSKAKIVIREQNIEYQLWQSYKSHCKNLFHKAYLQLQIQRLKASEQKYLASADGIIVLTDNDANEINVMGITVPKITIPIGIDFTNIISLPKLNNHVIRFYHLGSMDWLPNIQGIDWFLKEVIPQLNLTSGKFEIHLAGKNMPKYFMKKSNSPLIVKGKILDATEFINDKNILLVPLLSGGGIRVKIIEALANRKVVISTTIGAQGIPIQESGIIIANSADEFAFQIARICHQPELIETLGKKGYEFAYAKFNVNVLGNIMANFFKTLCSKSS